MFLYTEFRVVNPHEVLQQLVDVLLGLAPAGVHLLDGRRPVGLEPQRLLAGAVARLLTRAGAAAGTDST